MCNGLITIFALYILAMYRAAIRYASLVITMSDIHHTIQNSSKVLRSAAVVAIKLHLLPVSFALAERFHALRHQPCRTSASPLSGGRHEGLSRSIRPRPSTPLPSCVQNAEVLEKPQTRISRPGTWSPRTETTD